MLFFFKSARRELNPRLTLIRGRLSPLSYAPNSVGPEGFEPPPCRLKVCCAAVTPRPHIGRAYAFESSNHQHVVSPDSCVLSGSPEDRTQRDPRIRRIRATSPRLPCSSRAPRSRTETLLLPKQACFHLHLRPIVLSVRTAGFEPTISWPPAKRDARLRHVLIEYPVGESNPNPAGIRSPSACPLDGACRVRHVSAKRA